MSDKAIYGALTEDHFEWMAHGIQLIRERLHNPYGKNAQHAFLLTRREVRWIEWDLSQRTHALGLLRAGQVAALNTSTRITQTYMVEKAKLSIAYYADQIDRATFDRESKYLRDWRRGALKRLEKVA